MEKELFAVVAIYKSEAMNYLRDNNIAREEALIITTVEDFEKAKTKLIKDVKLISAPMGLSSNEDDLKKLLLLTREEEVADLLKGVSVGAPKTMTVTIKGVNTEGREVGSPITGGDSPSKEVRETVEPEVEIPKVPEVKNPPKTPLKDELKSEKPAAKKPITRKKKTTKK